MWDRNKIKHSYITFLVMIESVPKKCPRWWTFRWTLTFLPVHLSRLVFPCKPEGEFDNILINSGCSPFSWANCSLYGLGMAKSWAKFRIVNFVPKSCLPFAQISSIYLKTTAKLWNRYQKWLWRNGTQFLFGIFWQEKKDHLFRRSIAPRKVSTETTWESFSIYFYCYWKLL